MTPEQVSSLRLGQTIADDDDIEVVGRKQRLRLPGMPRRAHVMAAPFQVIGKIGRHGFRDTGKRHNGPCGHVSSPPTSIPT